MPGHLHHIEWCVGDAEKIGNALRYQFGFSLVHERNFYGDLEPQRLLLRQIALQSGEVVFLLTESRCDELQLKQIQEETCHEYPVLTCCSSSDKHLRDTVFNVCIEVGNVHSVTDRVEKANHDYVLKEPMPLINGEVNSSMTCSVVRSCVGNLIHSIISLEGDRGSFLPGFKEVFDENERSMTQPLTSAIDHVTYICKEGETRGILQWYSKCFGMKRFLTNSQETFEDNGVEIGGEVGMRMTVGEWISSWLCREEGVKFNNECDSDLRNFKLVIAEPLEGRSDSHVQHFMDNHKGPGLQHIGLSVTRRGEIEDVVAEMTRNGAEFRRPPPTYYKMQSKMEEIALADGNLDTFKNLGLLLDSEADYDSEDEDLEGRFLIQIFTKPLFSTDTFFLRNSRKTRS